MKGKVEYPGHAFHGKTVEIDGEEDITVPNEAATVICRGYRIPMPEGHVILLPKSKVRLLAEVS